MRGRITRRVTRGTRRTTAEGVALPIMPRVMYQSITICPKYETPMNETQWTTSEAPSPQVRTTRAEAPEYACLELDLIKVKGKDEAVRIFSLQGDTAHRESAAFAALSERHQAMLDAYRAQEWARARQLLAECRTLDGTLETLYDLKFVGDIRGAGYFYGIELVKDSASQVRFTDEECKQLRGEILSPRTFELGLICRTEDKAEPVIQSAPPLVAGPEEFREIVSVLRQAITEAQEIMA